MERAVIRQWFGPQVVEVSSTPEAGAPSLWEAESCLASGAGPPVEMISGTFMELFSVSGVFAGITLDSEDPISGVDSRVPLVVGFASGVGERAGLGSGVGERAGLVSGVTIVAVADGLTADGVASGLVGVRSEAGETAVLVGVVASFESDIGVTAFGASGLGGGLTSEVEGGLTSWAGVVLGVGLTAGFTSGVTAGLGSGDGLKLGFDSGVGEMVIFVSCVGARESLGSGDGAGLRAAETGVSDASFTSGVVAGLGGEDAVSLDSCVAVGLASEATEELNKSLSAMGAVGPSVSLSSGRPAVVKPTPESLVSRFFSRILVSFAETSRP